MELNSQSSTNAQQSEAIIIDRRFGKRSDIVRQNISRGVKRYMRRSPGEVSAQHAKLRDQRLGKRRGRPTGPNPSKSRANPSWEIVKLRANGASLPAIAKECGMKLSGAHYYAETLDLPSGFYDWGAPFSKRHARHLWGVSGLTYSEFAKQIGISLRSVQADLSPKRSSEYIYPERARKYLGWRDRVVQELLVEAPGEKGNRIRWGKSSVLKTFFSNLGAIRGLLVETIPAIRTRLQANPKINLNLETDAAQFGEWICAQAQFEMKRTPRILCWRKLARWLPQLMPTLMRNPDILRSGYEETSHKARVSQLAMRLLATHVGVSSSTLQRAMEQKTKQIAPSVLCRLIENIGRPTSGPQITRGKRRPGPQGPRKIEAEKAYFKIGCAVEQITPRMQDLMLLRRKPRKELLELGCSDQEIDAIHMPGSRTAVVAARWLVSIGKALPFDVVGEYHRDYLKATSKP